MAVSQMNPVAGLNSYELRHLVAHLVAAERHDRLHELLALETTDQRNAWYLTKESRGNVDGYLADVDRAWQTTAIVSVINEDEAGLLLSLQIRYALISASFNSLASRVGPKALSLLVSRGVWSSAYGLTLAQRVPEPEKRARCLAALLDCCSATLRDLIVDEVLAVTSLVQSSRDRAEIVLSISDYLTEHHRGQVVAGILEWLEAREQECKPSEGSHGLPRSIAWEQPMTEYYMTRSWRNSKEKKRMEGIYATRYQEHREALAILAPLLIEEDTDVIESSLRQIQDLYSRLSALCRLTKAADDKHRSRLSESVLMDLEHLERGYERASLLAEIAPCLSETLREQVEQDVLDELREIADPVQAVRICTALAARPQFKAFHHVLDYAVMLLQQVTDPDERVEASASILEVMEETHLLYNQILNELLASFSAIGDEEDLCLSAKDFLSDDWPAARDDSDVFRPIQSTGGVLVDMRPVLNIASLSVDEVLRQARTYPRDQKAHVLVDFALELEPAKRADLLTEALYALRGFRRETEEDYRCAVFSKLAPMLPQELLQDALRVAQDNSESDLRAKAIVALVPYLSENLLSDALDAVFQIWWYEQDMAFAVAEMSNYMSPPLLQEVIEKTRPWDAGRRSSVLCWVARRYSDLGYIVEALKLGLDDDPCPPNVLTGLVHNIGAFDRESQIKACQQLLHALANYSRKDMLGALRIMRPVLSMIGGGRVPIAFEVSKSIEDIGRWWP